MNALCRWLAMSVALAALMSGDLATPLQGADDQDNAPRKPVAVVTTVYRHNSHGDMFVTRLLEGYSLDGRGPFPSLRLASLYVDQVPDNDLSRPMAAKHTFLLADAPQAALTLGGESLAVDGVLLIAEHGNYPKSETGQVQYPKRRLFSEVVKVFERSGRVMPVFIDKHLAHNWTDAKWIYDTAQRRKIPLMAGSSLPSYRRVPAVDVRRGEALKEIVAVGYGGTESYGFHTLEMMQCLAERRQGGETGVQSVACLTGEAVWQAGDRNHYDPELLDAALARNPNRRHPDRPLREVVKEPVLFSITYNDGLRASVLMLNGAVSEFSVAWRNQGGRVESTRFALQDDRPYAHFTYLLKGIEKMMHSGHPTWPVERTLLTTGMLHAAMTSLNQHGHRIVTPHLDVRYQSSWNWTQPEPASLDRSP